MKSVRFCAIYAGGLADSPGRDPDGDWWRARLEIDGHQVRYANSRRDREIILAADTVRSCTVLDRKGRILTPSKKPARKISLRLEVTEGNGVADATFKPFGRGRSIARGAAAALRIALKPTDHAVDDDLRSVDECEIASFLSRDFPETSFVGFERMSPEHARLFATQWRRLAHGYPRVAVRVSTVKLAPVPVKKKGCMGVTLYTEGQPLEIILSEKHFVRSAASQTDDLVLLNEAVRFGPTGACSVASVLTHEFGHAIHQVTLHEYGGAEAATDLGRVLPPSTAAEVSGYAMTSPMELFAEAFSLLHHGEPSTRPGFIESLRQYLERLYGTGGSFRPLRPSPSST